MADKRRRIYYNKGQTTNGLNTKGGEWMFTDNTEYIGQYHTYTTNEVFSEPSFVDGKSRILIPYVDINDKLLEFTNIGMSIVSNFDYDAIKSVDVTPSKFTNPSISIPTSDDVSVGYMLRYFAYKVNDANITELDKDGFGAVGTKDGLDKYLWKRFSLRWKIAGPDFDIIDSNGNIKEAGIIDTNQRTITLHSEDYPTLKRYVTDFTAITA